jgi:hypothetical protein
MKVANISFFVTIALALSGCYPACGVARNGVRGRVVYSTGQPVPNAELVFTTSLDAQSYESGRAMTDIEGRFCIQPHYSMYVTWLFTGPILKAAPPTSVSIHVQGYNPMAFRIAERKCLPLCVDEMTRCGEFKDGYFEFNEIAIEKHLLVRDKVTIDRLCHTESPQFCR